MTARQLVVAGRRYNVEGEGYSTNGRILHVAGETDMPLEPYLLPMALANDAAVRDGEIVGDPTEAALVVLAAKGGVDVDETRRAYPRVGRGAVRLRLQADGDLPRDGGGRAARSCAASSRERPTCCSHARRTSAMRTASTLPVEAVRERVLAENDRLAGEGLRVLAVAARDLDPAGFRSRGVRCSTRCRG